MKIKIFPHMSSFHKESLSCSPKQTGRICNLSIGLQIMLSITLIIWMNFLIFLNWKKFSCVNIVWNSPSENYWRKSQQNWQKQTTSFIINPYFWGLYFRGTFFQLEGKHWLAKIEEYLFTAYERKLKEYKIKHKDRFFKHLFV